jgi:DnaD/phage-associated family protein
MATDRPAPGFPSGVSFTPVPSPLLGHILAEITDPSELRVTLRFIWLASQKKGVPRPVRFDELVADRVIAAALGLTGDDLAGAVRRAVAGALERGTLARFPSSDGLESYVLNTEPERRAIARLGISGRAPGAETSLRSSEPAPAVADRPNIYVIYEQNIGPLTPMAGQLLNEAAMSFPEEWIREAIQIAVANNARNWKYVSAILDRWATEGKLREQSGRDLQEDRLEPYRRAYGRYLKRP